MGWNGGGGGGRDVESRWEERASFVHLGGRVKVRGTRSLERDSVTVFASSLSSQSVRTRKMARKFFVGGNWKMNGTKSEINDIVAFLKKGPLDPNVGT